MSNNYEVLRQADKDQALFQNPGRRAAGADGKRSRPDVTDPAREEAIKLVQRLFLSAGAQSPRTVVFSSVEHGNGCSKVCAQVAEGLASQVEGAVCLVDANLRSPTLHRLFRIENELGLVDAVAQSGPVKKFLQSFNGSNLWILPSGPLLSDSHTLLSSDRFLSRLMELRLEFSHVLIDAPPISPYADAVTLGRLADGLVLVLEANTTRRETARKVKETLEAANVRLLGAVLNKRTFPIPERLYKRL
jgi:capsular exopolysaccharide synthesis family protein